jgi:hypothetical protein
MPREFHFLDESAALDSFPSDDGRHLIVDDLAGAKVFVEIDGGEVIGFHAQHDTDDNVEVLLIQQYRGGGSTPQALPRGPVKCFLCACSGDSCTCIPRPCPGG